MFLWKLITVEHVDEKVVRMYMVRWIPSKNTTINYG